MTLNHTNIRLVRDHIAGLKPERFDMSSWAYDEEAQADVETPKKLLHNCGTCACIGGWTMALLQKGKLFQPNANEKAAKLLGLSSEDAKKLFHPYGYAKPWQDITQAEAVAVLDHLLATGEVSWEVAKGAGE